MPSESMSTKSNPVSFPIRKHHAILYSQLTTYDKKQPRSGAVQLKTNMETYGLFRNALLERNVYTLPDGRWYIGASHSDVELAFVAEAIAEGMGVACG